MHQSLLECKFDRHQKSKIIGVCVHKQCQNRRPFCVGCQYQFHQDHIDDLKFFDDLKDWVLQNSQITVGITTYLNELIDLVKSISQLIEATQYANQHSNFNQMNYTDLENSINYLMNLWNCQNNVNQLLQEMLITKTRNQIKQLCSFYFLQYTTNNKIQVNQQSLQLNQNLTQKQITEGPQNVIQSKNQQQIPDQRISNLSKRFQCNIIHQNKRTKSRINLFKSVFVILEKLIYYQSQINKSAQK
ncbi:unnamed protein product [Paramecium sonneborni]|uniref:Uncharacterized protein n=1 Tax=Paramecium sonneborni TaxID=65129 RepID=A0A8S1P9H2_9CILI|nr:unnamed protein product [Paramecium sonneborni]